MLSDDDIIEAYRFLLGRAPENETVVAELKGRHATLASLRTAFLASDELLSQLASSPQQRSSSKPLGWPAMHVEHEVPASEVEAMLRHIHGNWQALGESEPHWSVLSDEAFRASQIAETEEAFYETGEHVVALMRAALARNGLSQHLFESCLELGCGVGRVTLRLAQHYSKVLALDVSPSHLQLAQARAAATGACNIDFRRLAAVGDIAGLPAFDAFVSIIVLQHNPPPVIGALLQAVLTKLEPGGIGYFQLSTYHRHYEFRSRGYLERMGATGAIEMHHFPQRALFDLLRRCDCDLLEFREDPWTGQDDGISNTVLVRKRPDPSVPARIRPTLACVSIRKTGSTALTAALRAAGFPGALHLHHLGPLARRHGAEQPAGSPDVGVRVDDPQHAFEIVACVRDPIARVISDAFHIALKHRERTGVDIVRDPGAIVSWVDGLRFGEASTLWFEDTFQTTFGFDFRQHPFDHQRRSLRFSSPRLKLLVLRQEDPIEAKERELGWLVGRERVAIPAVNVSAARDFGRAYERMLATFVAPKHWLERFYETDVMRHFYTPAERDAFRARWRAPSPSAAARAASPAVRTYACISMGKTSSMALAAALRDAGCEGVLHLHYLGPRALTIKRANPEPMLAVAEAVAARIDDPAQAFSLVTGVREPISRALSQAFYNAERVKAETGEDIVRDADALVAWYERSFRGEQATPWFDDTYKATFGFDFRSVPFDQDRHSLRFEGPRMRVLILRQEDPSVFKERELGWLIGRDRVALPVVNDSASRGYQAAYRAFLATFVAPDRWLDSVYETEFAKHFYNAEEIAAFKLRWSGGRS